MGISCELRIDIVKEVELYQHIASNIDAEFSTDRTVRATRTKRALHLGTTRGAIANAIPVDRAKHAALTESACGTMPS